MGTASFFEERAKEVLQKRYSGQRDLTDGNREGNAQNINQIVSPLPVKSW